MEYKVFLNKVIEHSIESVCVTYSKPEDKNKLEAAIAGFEACRDKMPDELVAIYKEAVEYQQQELMLNIDPKTYWWFRYYVLQVEWTLNVVSAGINRDLLGYLPTTRGMRLAIAIIIDTDKQWPITT